MKTNRSDLPPVPLSFSFGVISADSFASGAVQISKTASTVLLATVHISYQGSPCIYLYRMTQKIHADQTDISYFSLDFNSIFNYIILISSFYKKFVFKSQIREWKICNLKKNTETYTIFWKLFKGKTLERYFHEDSNRLPFPKLRSLRESRVFWITLYPSIIRLNLAVHPF